MNEILLIWPKGMRNNDWSLFPIGFGYLNNMVDCDILDASLHPLSDEKLAQIASKYAVIGISVWGFNIVNVQHTVDVIKDSSDALVVLGGPSAHLVRADWAILGEGELNLKGVVDYLNQPAETNKPIKNIPITYHPTLDDFGLIDYKKLHLDEYIDTQYKDWMYTLKDKFRSAPIMATRGCPYHCAYCQGPVIMGKKIRKHSIGYILETIENLYRSHAIRQISFLDDNLTFDMAWAKELCENILIMKEKKNLDFIITTLNGIRVNRLDEELITLMKRAGWAEVVIAPESGSPATLKRMKKTIDLTDVEKKVELFHKHRMTAAAYFMLGYPGETRSDLDMTRDYILNSKIDRCIINYFNPTPGTPIYDKLVQEGKLEDQQKFINYKTVKFVTEGLTEKDLTDTMEAVSEKTIFREKWIKDL
ncbi:MAG: B12-binding domain-containing radical SAM protein [Proteobacteria bacterium]|nr:B12-binding domain-containing radical SAM protein [Pseudomonadota bacterium]MBU4471477.1 B12-binding domain-containing radical SAM protein [Pseudomonadota bacterium]MCG2752483.1 B12-binding domain-containing radical SAM protein [Desulfobacteraceae bacterium]